MTEKLHAILNPDGSVAQVVVWDGVTPWAPSKTLTVKPCTPGVGPGWKFANAKFVAPVLSVALPINTENAGNTNAFGGIL